MKWTMDIPLESGWYWHRWAHGDRRVATPIYLARVEPKYGIPGAFTAAGAFMPFAPLSEEWSGPIPLPEEE